MKNKIKDFIKSCIHEELIDQVINIYCIEINNYAYGKGLTVIYENPGYSEFNIYIEKDKKQRHILHLHDTDFLWAILNNEKVIKEAKKEIDIFLKEQNNKGIEK